MTTIEKLSKFDFPDLIFPPYEQDRVVDITRKNFEVLLNRHNDLVKAFNELSSRFPQVEPEQVTFEPEEYEPKHKGTVVDYSDWYGVFASDKRY